MSVHVYLTKRGFYTECVGCGKRLGPWKIEATAQERADAHECPIDLHTDCRCLKSKQPA